MQIRFIQAPILRYIRSNNRIKLLNTDLIKSQPQIGKGIYTVSDMSKIFRIPSSKVRYMFNAYVRDKFEKAGDYRFYFGEKNNFVNFDTLIHLYVFFQLREKGFKNKDIFNLYKTASEDQGTPFPFSEDLRIYTESKKFILREGESYYTADQSRQFYFSEIIEPLSNKIEYSDSGILKFYPLGKDKTIVIDPKVQLGAPTIAGTRINAKTIYKLHEAGENHNVISNIYNISAEQIKDAVEYYSKAA